MFIEESLARRRPRPFGTQARPLRGCLWREWCNLRLRSRGFFRFFRIGGGGWFWQVDFMLFLRGCGKIFKRGDNMTSERHILEGGFCASKGIRLAAPSLHTCFGQFLKDTQAFVGFDQLPEHRHPVGTARRARSSNLVIAILPDRQTVRRVKKDHLNRRRQKRAFGFKRGSHDTLPLSWPSMGFGSNSPLNSLSAK